MIQLNYRDSRPYYQQIMDNVRQLIVSGILQSDEKLPSVRDLASNLAINPNTIQRAYRELEAEGYVYSLSGKGTFVSPLADGSIARQRELLKVFEDAAKELLYLKVPGEKLENLLAQLKQEYGMPQGEQLTYDVEEVGGGNKE